LTNQNTHIYVHCPSSVPRQAGAGLGLGRRAPTAPLLQAGSAHREGKRCPPQWVGGEPLLLPLQPETWLGPTYKNTNKSKEKSQVHIYMCTHMSSRGGHKATGTRRGSAGLPPAQACPSLSTPSAPRDPGGEEEGSTATPAPGHMQALPSSLLVSWSGDEAGGDGLTCSRGQSSGLGEAQEVSGGTSGCLLPWLPHGNGTGQDPVGWPGVGEGAGGEGPHALRTRPLGSILPLGHPAQLPSKPQAPESCLGIKQGRDPR